MKKNYIGIREARISLSKLIRDVKSGMEIIITDRGTPVAKIIPADGKTLSLEERIKNFQSCGLIESCTGQGQKSYRPIEIPPENIKRNWQEDVQDE